MNAYDSDKRLLILAASGACATHQTARDQVTPPPAHVDVNAPASRVLKWSELSPDSLWCVIRTMSDSVVTIGLTRPRLEDAVVSGRIMISPQERATATDTVRAMRGVVVLRELGRIPVLQAKLLSEDAFRMVLASPWVAYVEPDRMFQRFVFPRDC